MRLYHRQEMVREAELQLWASECLGVMVLGKMGVQKSRCGDADSVVPFHPHSPSLLNITMMIPRGSSACNSSSGSDGCPVLSAGTDSYDTCRCAHVHTHACTHTIKNEVLFCFFLSAKY